MLQDISLAVVRALLDYDKETGILSWRNPSGRYGRIPAGTPAGTLNKEGYRYVVVEGRHYRASRLIWFHVTGVWPPSQVDHIDRNPSNDKWSNLRLATGSQNKANNRKYQSKNSAGMPKGVQLMQGRRSVRYRAIATKDGKRIHLGYFDTPETAHAAYRKASEELHGEFASSE